MKQSGLARQRTTLGVQIAVPVLLAVWCFWGLILGPNLRSAMKVRSMANETNYVREADYAVLAYANDHGGRLPKLTENLGSILKPYLKDPKAIQAMNRFVWNDKMSGTIPGDHD